VPRWLEPNRLPPGSRDPLGFQSHAERLANEVLPGLTVFTNRIGYYGFIAWAVARLNGERPPATVSRHTVDKPSAVAAAILPVIACERAASAAVSAADVADNPIAFSRVRTGSRGVYLRRRKRELIALSSASSASALRMFRASRKISTQDNSST
jgi:hypothetical protein